MGKYEKIIKKVINLKYHSDMDWSFEFPDGSYTVSDIQDYFEYIFKMLGMCVI